MRKLLVALFMVGLLVAPTLGATINVELKVNGASGPATMTVGVPATVEGWFTSPAPNGLISIGGNVVVSGSPTATLNTTGSMVPTTFYVAGFQGFQIGQPQQILPSTPVAGANGAVSSIGSSQFGVGNPTSGLSWDTTLCNTATKLFSYQVTPTGAGTITLQWQDVGSPGFNGWYTTDTASPANDGINTNTAVAITVNPAVSNNSVTASTVDNAVAGKKTNWRTKKTVIRLTFASALSSAPTAGQIKIFKCLAGGVEDVDLSSNFTFTLESGGTVVKCLDSSTAGVLANRTWYAIRIGTLPNCNTILSSLGHELLIPTLVGDVDGNGVLSSAADINAIVAKLSSPSTAGNDADRRDLDGNLIVSATADVNPAVAGLATPTLPAKPAGW